MKTIKRNLILLLILVAAMAITKPSESSFSTWLSERYQTKTEETLGDNSIDTLLSKGKLKVTQAQLAGTAEYNNKYIFAIVNSKANNEDHQFLGIFGSWVKVP